MNLKKYPNHSEAFEHSHEKYEFEKMAFLFQHLFYLCRLYQLDQKAVSIKYPDPGDDERGVFLCHLMPIEADEENESDEEEWEPVPHIIETRHHLAHTQEKAAKFCKVNERTLQRWMKDGLRSFKLGKQRIFIQRDLWDYMAERGVGRLVKEISDYSEVECHDVDTDPIFQE